jgi:hypothetical protein
VLTPSSKTFAVLSCEPVATKRPLGATSRALMSLSWALIVVSDLSFVGSEGSELLHRNNRTQSQEVDTDE